MTQDWQQKYWVYPTAFLKITLIGFLIITKVTHGLCRESGKSEVQERKLQLPLIISSKDKNCLRLIGSISCRTQDGPGNLLASPWALRLHVSPSAKETLFSEVIFPSTQILTFSQGKKMLSKNSLLATSALQLGWSCVWFAVNKEQFNGGPQAWGSRLAARQLLLLLNLPASLWPLPSPWFGAKLLGTYPVRGDWVFLSVRVNFICPLG